jgi:hypothetical protein
MASQDDICHAMMRLKTFRDSEATVAAHDAEVQKLTAASGALRGCRGWDAPFYRPAASVRKGVAKRAQKCTL